MPFRRVFLVFVLYLALTIVMTWPLAAMASSVIPADRGDPLLNAWILWWNAHSVPLTESWWNAPIFYPSSGALAFSEHLLGLTWLTSPVQWAGGNPLAAYNAAFIASWVLGGTCAWLLGYELTGRADAALVGSAVFAFAPYRGAQVSHLQVLSAQWMPLALMAAHRYLRSGRPPWLAAFAVAWLALSLSNGYYLMFFGLLMVPWTLWFGTTAGRWKRLAALIGASGTVLIAVLPLLLQYRAIHEHYGFRRTTGEMAAYSADILSVLDSASNLAFWGWLSVFHRAEGELFPGVMVVLIVAAGLLLGPAPAIPAPWQRRVRPVMAFGWLIALAGCVSYGVAGRWRTSSLGFRITVRDPRRPLLAAAILGLALVLTQPGLRAAIARRSTLLFYLAAAVGLWWLTLGPSATFAGIPLRWPSPYALLATVPGFAGLRVPARLFMLVVLCLSAAASLAYARVPLAPRWRPAVLTVTFVLTVADGWVLRLPLVPAPAPWPAMVTHGSARPLLQLPGAPRQPEPVAMYRAALVQRPLVNGYSGHFPPAQAILVHAIGMYDLTVLDGPSAREPLDILLDRSRDFRGRLERRLGDTRAKLAGREGRWCLYELPPPSPGPMPRLSGRETRPVAAQASINADLAARVLDDRVDTRWYTAGQTPGQTLTLDFGRQIRGGALRLLQPGTPLQYPLRLEIDRSIDGMTWSRAWEGPTAARAWLAAVESPRLIPLTIPLDGCAARYLRLRLAAESPHQIWSVAEVSLLEAAEARSEPDCQP